MAPASLVTLLHLVQRAHQLLLRMALLRLRAGLDVNEAAPRSACTVHAVTCVPLIWALRVQVCIRMAFLGLSSWCKFHW